MVYSAVKLPSYMSKKDDRLLMDGQCMMDPMLPLYGNLDAKTHLPIQKRIALDLLERRGDAPDRE